MLETGQPTFPMKSIPRLFLAALVLAAACPDLFAVASPSLSPPEPPVEQLGRTKIFCTMARRTAGIRRSVCVYRGSSHDLARWHKQAWDQRPGWEAEVITEKF